MNRTESIRLILAVAGLFFLGLGIRQLKTRVAWTLVGQTPGFVQREAFPLLYWQAVLGNLILGGIFTALSVFADLE